MRDRWLAGIIEQGTWVRVDVGFLDALSVGRVLGCRLVFGFRGDAAEYGGTFFELEPVPFKSEAYASDREKYGLGLGLRD